MANKITASTVQKFYSKMADTAIADNVRKAVFANDDLTAIDEASGKILGESYSRVSLVEFKSQSDSGFTTLEKRDKRLHEIETTAITSKSILLVKFTLTSFLNVSLAANNPLFARLADEASDTEYAGISRVSKSEKLAFDIENATAILLTPADGMDNAWDGATTNTKRTIPLPISYIEKDAFLTLRTVLQAASNGHALQNAITTLTEHDTGHSRLAAIYRYYAAKNNAQRNSKDWPTKAWEKFNVVWTIDSK